MKVIYNSSHNMNSTTQTKYRIDRYYTQKYLKFSICKKQKNRLPQMKCSMFTQCSLFSHLVQNATKNARKIILFHNVGLRSLPAVHVFDLFLCELINPDIHGLQSISCYLFVYFLWNSDNLFWHFFMVFQNIKN